MIKYLASRDTPAKRKWFRQVRKRLQEASAYARKAMLDAKGVLNPGMMPRTLDDLANRPTVRHAGRPPRVALEPRRGSLAPGGRLPQGGPPLRHAIRPSSTRSSADLWPEVVYPLIERAHWQRTFRPRHEAIWDYVVGKLLHVPVPGVRLDRMMVVAIPLEVAEQLDEDLAAFVDEPRLDEDANLSESQGGEGKSPFYVGGTIPRDETSDEESQCVKRRPFYFGSKIPREELPDDDDSPVRQAEDPTLLGRAVRVHPERPPQPVGSGADAQGGQLPAVKLVHRTIPVGPYELAVVPTGGGGPVVRSCGLAGDAAGKADRDLHPSGPRKRAPPRGR